MPLMTDLVTEFHHGIHFHGLEGFIAPERLSQSTAHKEQRRGKPHHGEHL
jgi:hypothetical protein